MNEKKAGSVILLKKRMLLAIYAVFLTLLAGAAATFAWYVYNTERYTTNVKMAAGAGTSIQISNSYDGTYGSSTVLKEFVGTLNPVSTDSIRGGFQKVFGFTNGSENQPTLVASLFGKAISSDYYKTTLFVRTNGDTADIYLSDIGFQDSDKNNPISTAIRVGLVVYEPGRAGNVKDEFIFEINKGSNPQGVYNTATGQDGYVLDSKKTDGTTRAFTPLSSANFCNYDTNTGVTTLKPDSRKLFTLKGKNGGYGDSVQVDVYIWLEGCDKDCTNNLCSTTLKNAALSFAAYRK
ncbi:MAG: hypothetical protein Q4B59_00745 [Lachnospiraceae bacterium]|nr:hypothetical protein [Lachnospiraceae bacterium]